MRINTSSTGVRNSQANLWILRCDRIMDGIRSTFSAGTARVRPRPASRAAVSRWRPLGRPAQARHTPGEKMPRRKEGRRGSRFPTWSAGSFRNNHGTAASKVTYFFRNCTPMVISDVSTVHPRVSRVRDCPGQGCRIRSALPGSSGPALLARMDRHRHPEGSNGQDVKYDSGTLTWLETGALPRRQSAYGEWH